MTSVAVIDYGMGNLRSVAKALEHAGPRARVTVTSDASQILAADRLVFPGQGAIGDAMNEIRRLDLEQTIRTGLAEKPFLGICLGLQALLEHSEEDNGTDGFGVFPGTVRRFPQALVHPESGESIKVPHMGWNGVHQTMDHPLWNGIEQDSRFYFVHSYYADTSLDSVVAGRTHYGVDFVCAAARDNIFAVQFHPEKSAGSGLRLLQNFLEWDVRV